MKLLLWYSTIVMSLWLATYLYMGLSNGFGLGGLGGWVSAILATPVVIFLWKLALAFGKGDKEAK